MVCPRKRFALLATVLCISLLVRGTGAAEGEGAFASRGILFGYSSRLISQVTRSDAQAALTLWTRELTRLADYPVVARSIVYEDLTALVAAVHNKEIDIIALTPLDYLKIRDRVPMEPALIGVRNGRTGDEQVLVVRREDGIRNVNQLKGKRLTLLAGGAGEIPSLWLDTILAKQGFPDTAKFFGGIKEVSKASQAILPVFFHQADACIITRNAFSTAAELNPQIEQDLVILASSPEFPPGITFMRATLSKAQKDEFIRLSQKMVLSPTGKQILTLFKVDNIMVPRPDCLKNFEALVKEHENYRTLAKGSR